MHNPTVCDETNGWYHHRSCSRTGHWMLEFTCPACGRIGKFQRNFLGQRKVICNGHKFERVEQRNIAASVAGELAHA